MTKRGPHGPQSAHGCACRSVGLWLYNRKERTMARKHWTISRIRQEMMRRGSHHWDRKTMRFFGETVKNYSVRNDPDGTTYVIRRGGRCPSKLYRYDEANADLVEVK